MRALLAHAAVAAARIHALCSGAQSRASAAASAAALAEGAALEAFGAAARAAIEGGTPLPRALFLHLPSAGGEGRALPALVLTPAAAGAAGAPAKEDPHRTPLLHRGDLAPAEAPAGEPSAGDGVGGSSSAPQSLAALAAAAPPWLVARIGRALVAAATSAALSADANATGPAPTLPPAAFTAAVARAVTSGEGGGAPLWARAGAAALRAAAHPAPGMDWTQIGAEAELPRVDAGEARWAPAPGSLAAQSPLHAWAASYGGGAVPWRRALLSLLVCGPARDCLALAQCVFPTRATPLPAFIKAAPPPR